jgi:hypothetical protein
MRSVIIVNDRENQRPWLAVDRGTGSELLRLRDRDQLEKVCARLGWVVTTAGSKRGATANGLQRVVRRLTRRVATRRAA